MTDEARQRALAVIASAEASLAEYRDPDVIARAEAWQRDYDERNPPKPAPLVTRSAPKVSEPYKRNSNLTKLDVEAIGVALAEVDKRIRQTVEIIGEETGANEKRMRAEFESRLDAIETENRLARSQLLARIALLEAEAASRRVIPVTEARRAPLQ